MRGWTILFTGLYQDGTPWHVLRNSPVGSRGELGEDAGVQRRDVLGPAARAKPKALHGALPKQNGQPFPVHDVLGDGAHQLAGHPEDGLVGPSRAVLVELPGDEVVKPEEDGVDRCQAWLLVHSQVACGTEEMDEVNSSGYVRRNPFFHASS